MLLMRRTPDKATRQLRLDPTEWGPYLKGVISGGDGLVVSVGVSRGAQLGLGAARPLRTLAYDPVRDVLEVGVGGSQPGQPLLRYFVAAPRAISVRESANEHEIMVEDGGGTRTVIRLRVSRESETRASARAALPSRLALRHTAP
jgi:hypothetical protein